MVEVAEVGAYFSPLELTHIRWTVGPKALEHMGEVGEEVLNSQDKTDIVVVSHKTAALRCHPVVM